MFGNGDYVDVFGPKAMAEDFEGKFLGAGVEKLEVVPAVVIGILQQD